MKCKTCGTDHRGVAKHGGYCLDHQERRAESAEARAAQLFDDCEFKQGQIESSDSRIRQLEAERDELRRQLEQAQNWIKSLNFIGIDSSKRYDYRSWIRSDQIGIKSEA